MSSFAVVLAASTGGTFIWRYLGVVAQQRMSADSPVLLWVRSVATALIAALIIRFVYDPSGLLAETLFSSRLTALAAAAVGFYISGKRIEAGVGLGAATLMGLEFLFHR